MFLFGVLFLDSRLNIFYDKYLFINFEIYEGNMYELLELLNKGIIEIVIVRILFNNFGINLIFLEKEFMIVVMVKDFNWIDSKVIDIRELEDKLLIFYRRFERLIFKVCYDLNFNLNVFCKNDDVWIFLFWVNLGFGIVIVLRFVIKLIGFLDIIYKEINNEELLI